MLLLTKDNPLRLPVAVLGRQTLQVARFLERYGFRFRLPYVTSGSCELVISQPVNAYLRVHMCVEKEACRQAAAPSLCNALGQAFGSRCCVVVHALRQV